ncbi:MAG: hypothetical protein Q8S21_00790 [Candidatus Paracaedibacteraceae bacterium]|nr:hypothetical protein [Candidatus Paracaedibacteraceae bacterium]
MNLRKILLLTSLISCLAIQHNYSNDDTPEGLSPEGIGQPREMNMAFKSNKFRTSLLVKNTTQNPATLSVLFCCHMNPKDPHYSEFVDNSDAAYIIIPAEEFSGIDIDSNDTDQTLWPNRITHLSKECKLEQHVKSNPSEENAIWLSREYTIPAQSEMKIFPHQLSYISALKLNTDSAFLAMHEIYESNCVLKITDTLQKSFPAIIGSVNFSNIFHEAPNHPSTTFFKDVVCAEEDFAPQEYENKVQDFYNANYKSLNKTNFTDPLSIPALLHNIRFESTPMPNAQIQLLATSMNSLDTWEHILWVNNYSESAETLNNRLHTFGLNPSINIQMKSYNEINSDMSAAVNALIEKGDYKAATNTASFDIIHKLGGVFRGSFVEILHNLDHHNRSFDLYTSLDTNIEYMPSPDLFAAVRGHETINIARHETNTPGPIAFAKAFMKSPSTARDIVLTTHFCAKSAQKLASAPDETIIPSYSNPNSSIRLETTAINHG